MTHLTFETVDRDKLTPMMRQLVEEKDRHPDCLIFFRLGDFYELFFDDALTVARELELKLTGRECGLDERAPMCGVPHHAADAYLKRLLNRGYKIAICEQVEDPAESKGLVAREVIRIVTPGTQVDPDAVDGSRYTFICAIYEDSGYYGLACCDLASGHFETTELIGERAQDRLFDELARFQPVEFVVNRTFSENQYFQQLTTRLQLTVTMIDDSYFSVDKAREYGLVFDERDYLWHRASAGLLHYLSETQQKRLLHLGQLKPYVIRDYMLLDRAARANLELTETLRDRKRRGSLLWAVDRTKTAMGSRMLRSWLEQPLLSIDRIMKRQLAVSYLKEHFILRQSLSEALTGLYDMERLSGKIALKTVTPRDLVSLRDALRRLPIFHDLFAKEDDLPIVLKDISASLYSLPELEEELSRALLEDPPQIMTEGGIFRNGYHEGRDELEALTLHGKDHILAIEAREKERTGIKSLKVGYNRVFGYYLEVSKAQSEHVPDDYVRRQTLTNVERYVTPELKEKEDRILGAEQKLKSLEYDLFSDLRDRVAGHIAQFQATGRALATLDTLISFARLAEEQHYCAPKVVDDPILMIEQGRHPVVEQMLATGEFVPNSLALTDEQRLMLLTGPNMSGKSTYMRQAALIVLLAQCGSFVPADSATIGLCDRIFTRVGASDDVSGGQSTFMVEMTEVASILSHATGNSLLILDEIGRGTSTADGLSIAWAVVEHISDPSLLGARTLFATHFHELIGLSDHMAGIFNAHIDVAERDGSIVFLHRICPGGTDESYGIDVAKLAGVPESVVDRAREIMMNLESEDRKIRRFVRKQSRHMEGQVDLFSGAQSVRTADAIVEKLQAADPNEMRPLDAYSLLLDLKELASRHGQLRKTKGEST